MRRRTSCSFPPTLAAIFVCAFSACGCDDSQKPKNPFEPPPKATVEPPKDAGLPDTKRAPDLAIDDLGPKVGFTRVLLDKPEGRDKLGAELKIAREHFEGKEAKLSVIRKAKLVWVMAMMNELGKIGTEKVMIRTETRKDYPSEIAFTPLAKAPKPEPCTVVGMVLADYATATWKVAGGTATKRGKGFAGPDLSLTAETLERFGKGCKQSSMFLVSAAEEVEWGLAYDLAATAKTLDDVKFQHIVVLEKVPVAGRKVEFDKP